MNDIGVNKELEFLSGVIALLDGAINAVGDAADEIDLDRIQKKHASQVEAP